MHFADRGVELESFVGFRTHEKHTDTLKKRLKHAANRKLAGVALALQLALRSTATAPFYCYSLTDVVSGSVPVIAAMGSDKTCLVISCDVAR